MSLAHRVAGMVARGVVVWVSDVLRMQGVQVQVSVDDTRDGRDGKGAERWQQYGFTSLPLPGSEALVLSVGGDAAHDAVICVDDRRYRLRGGLPGEVAIYDDLGQTVRLTRAGIVIDGGTIELGAGATESVVLGTSFAALFNAHVHTGVTPGGGSTGTTATPMTAGQLSATVRVAS
jgi:phage baseplate assembly protein V